MPFYCLENRSLSLRFLFFLINSKFPAHFLCYYFIPSSLLYFCEGNSQNRSERELFEPNCVARSFIINSLC